MKKYLILVFSLILFYSTANAEPCNYGVFFGYGDADSDVDVYRVGLKKDFSSRWFKTNKGFVSGYFDLSYNHWGHENKDINAVAFSPVLAYYFGDEAKATSVRPYIEGGIGLTYIDEYHISNRNLSSNFQFEDRIGVGIRTFYFDFSFKYMHYSNAGIKDPNDGIDMWMLTTAIRF